MISNDDSTSHVYPAVNTVLKRLEKKIEYGQEFTERDKALFLTAFSWLFGEPATLEKLRRAIQYLEDNK